MLMLRLMLGLNFADFDARTGSTSRVLFADEIQRLVRQQLLHIDDTHIWLTHAGLNVADAVAAEFLGE